LVRREELEVKATPGDLRGRHRYYRLHRAAAKKAVEDANPDIAGKEKNDAVLAELRRRWNTLLDDEKIEHVVAACEAQNAEAAVKATPGDKRGRNRHRSMHRAAAKKAVEDANPDIAGKEKNDAVEAELRRRWNALLVDEKIEFVVAAGEAQNAEAARMAEEPDGEPEPKRKRPAPVPRSAVPRSVADFKLVKPNFYNFFMQENRAAVEAEVDGDAANTGKTHKELVKTKLEENFRALDDFAKAQWRKDASVFYYFCGKNLERIVEDVEDVASAATWERLVKEKLAEAWRALDDGAKAVLAQGAADAAPVPAEPRAAPLPAAPVDGGAARAPRSIARPPAAPRTTEPCLGRFVVSIGGGYLSSGDYFAHDLEGIVVAIRGRGLREILTVDGASFSKRPAQLRH
ncbi:expressed protein, partial [Aureococcus anophagefferens]